MNRIVRITFLSVAVAAVTSCATVPLDDVEKFGEATSELADGASKAFQLLDSVEVERKMYYVASDPLLGPTDETFASFFRSDAPESLPHSLLETRLNLLSALGEYADSIAALASATEGPEIDAATLDLHSSLTNLSASYKKATGSDIASKEALGTVATLINATGKAIAARKQRESIRKVIVMTDPAVQQATALITDELSQDSEIAVYVRNSIATKRVSMQAAYNLQRTTPQSSFDTRLTRLEGIRQLYDAEARAPRAFEAISKGARKVGEAHTSLIVAASNKDFTSADLKAAIAELQAYAKSVAAFRASIKESV